MGTPYKTDYATGFNLLSRFTLLSPTAREAENRRLVGSSFFVRIRLQSGKASVALEHQKHSQKRTSDSDAQNTFFSIHTQPAQ
jgi:hypothetical protein